MTYPSESNFSRCSCVRPAPPFSLDIRRRRCHPPLPYLNLYLNRFVVNQNGCDPDAHRV
jgi:hypothetical protein